MNGRAQKVQVPLQPREVIKVEEGSRL